MTFLLKPKTISSRQIIRVVTAIAIAFLVQAYFSFTNEYWIVLIAFMISLTSGSTALRQGLNLLVITVIGIVLASGLKDHTTMLIQTLIVGLIYLGLGGYLVMAQLLVRNRFSLLAFFLLVIVLVCLGPVKSPEFLQYRLLDSIIGAAIGIICARWILQVPAPQAFRDGLVPILNAAIDYLAVMIKSIKYKDQQRLAKIKWIVENALRTQTGNYPEWVYEMGFNPGLRAGFRYFLIYLERVVETLFSIDYLLNTKLELPEHLADAVKYSLQKNQELFTILRVYFETNTLRETPIDLTSDISRLEKVLNEIVPGNLELLDVSPEYVSFTALVRDIKDMRQLLLQLLMSLPAGK